MFVYRTLHDNWFGGTIPSSLGNLTVLQWLTMQNNRLSGTLPASIGDIHGYFGKFSQNVSLRLLYALS